MNAHAAMRAEWQAAYDGGESAASIAARHRVGRRTVLDHIVTVKRTGPRPTLDPHTAVDTLTRCDTMRSAAAELDVTPNILRHALWRAGLVNDPLGKGRGDLDWPSGGGHPWDVHDRIAQRDRTICAMAETGMTADAIADVTSIDRDIITRALRGARKDPR